MSPFSEGKWGASGGRSPDSHWGWELATRVLSAQSCSCSLSCPAAPQIKSFYWRQQQVLSLQSLGYKNQRVKWMFSSENWHWTEGRKRLLQFKHVLISGEVGTEEGQNWLRNQWESHKFCLLSRQLRFSLYSATHFFFSFKRAWIMNSHFLNSQVQKSLSGGRKRSFE